MRVQLHEFIETNDGWRRDEKKYEWRTCEAEDMIEILSDIQDKFSGRPLGDIWLTYFPKLCPVSFVEPWFNFWMEVESACSEYGILPYEGGLLDQLAVVLDILSTIRVAKNQYYLWKDMKRKQEIDRKK